jgi:hypothetical protein
MGANNFGVAAVLMPARCRAMADVALPAVPAVLALAGGVTIITSSEDPSAAPKAAGTGTGTGAGAAMVMVVVIVLVPLTRVCACEYGIGATACGTTLSRGAASAPADELATDTLAGRTGTAAGAKICARATFRRRLRRAPPPQLHMI